MNKNRFFLAISFVCALFGSGCDLQPKIASIPDNIGMFIEERYPALLADPETQPEIYNSAVTDYGVYASPQLYGSSSAKTDDYVLYASVNDYVLVPEQTKISQTDSENDYLIVPKYTKSDSQKTSDEIIVVKGDTLYSLARSRKMTVSELAEINGLKEPYTLSVGQKLSARRADVKEVKVVKQDSQTKQNLVETKNVTKTTKRVDLQEITVAKGDTLYSISRKYEIPVNDLAVMNKLSAPFSLSVGQKLKVPKLNSVQTGYVVENKSKTTTLAAKKTEQVVKVEKSQKPEKPTYTADKDKKKISSDPTTKLPKISARSSAKFSWPVRGKILSGYGSKGNGLFNDGINISASLGTAVKAAENGVIAYAGNEVKGMGNLIIIQHSDGWMTVYAHLDSMSVKRGTKVVVGQQIGKVGKTGKVDAPQLHFEIRKGTKAYNPTQYLKK